MLPSFPNLSTKVYAKLYYTFRNTVPTIVTTSYLETLLNASKSSAGVYIRDLKTIGFVDSDGNTTKLVHKWKMPDTYVEACQEILKKVYPEELLQIAGDKPEVNVIKRWFKAEGMNENIARQRAGFFCLLYGDHPPEKPEDGQKTKSRKPRNNISKSEVLKTPTKEMTNEPSLPAQAAPVLPKDNAFQISNDVNVNIQIHIGADATTDQIEAIFKNMSKYLK